MTNSPLLVWDVGYVWGDVDSVTYGGAWIDENHLLVCTHGNESNELDDDLSYFAHGITFMSGMHISDVISDLSWVTWADVIRYAGMTLDELFEMALDPKRTVHLYELASGYYGLHELDCHPTIEGKS